MENGKMKTEWKKFRLGEICDYITSGGTPLASRNDYYNPPVIPWLKTKEVNYSRITQTENFISQKGLDNSSAKLIPENSVIIAMYGQGDTAGRVAINKIPLTTNQACCNFIIDKKKADYNFVYYQLCTLYDKMVSLKSGGAQPNLNAGKLKELEISLPPLETQQKIAGILSAYDDLIENNRKQIKLLEEAAQKLYKEWFVKLNFPGHENVKIVDGVPEGWRKGKVDDVIIYHDTKRKPLSSIERSKMKGEYRYYGAASILDYVNSYLFDGTYLLLGEDGTVITADGYPVLQYITGKFWVNNHAHVLTGKDYFSTEFVYMMFSCMKIKDIVTGAAQPKISQARLSNKEIILPNETLVGNFSDMTKPIFDKIFNSQILILNLQSARDKLLPRLMNGDINV